jgi:PKD repeat protein
MKKTLLVLCGAFLALTSFSQKCFTDQMLEERFQENPNLRDEAYRFMTNLAETENERVINRAEPLIIPIVFHVLHDNGNGNISEAQLNDAVRVLNLDLRRQNADTTDTRALFEPFAADISVEFRLAKLDPNGFCTNGITRHNKGSFSYDARDGVKRNSTGGVNAWPVNKYFNIWVVNSIQGSGGEGITLGYAQFPYPGFGGINATYGIVARQDYLGTIGTSNDDGRMLTHEVGHCLGLFHTFQGGCSSNCSAGGDYICDTPPSSESTFGCNFNQNSCVDPSSDPYPGENVDQIENYMSYDNCTNMFSEGQKVRMRDVLTNGAGQTPIMLNLTSASNHEATGVFIPDAPCQVIFTASTYYTCVNTPVNFNDFSFAKISNWAWSFPGGSPATSNEKNPTVTYEQPGSYSVMLTIGDSVNNSVDSTYLNLITITENDILSGPYSEGFESATNITNLNWYPVNVDNDNTSWSITSNAGKDSQRSLYLNNYVNDNYGSVDYLLSDPYDLSSLPDAIFKFDQCYAMTVNNNADVFKIEVSNDCGDSWTTIRENSGFSIGASVIEPNFSYVPPNNKWRSFFSVIPNEFLTTGVKFKITFVNGNGNNFYLDNINITSTVGISTLDLASAIHVYPNPINDEATINIKAQKSNTVSIVLTDLLGKQALTINNESITTGDNSIKLNIDGISSGVYLLKVAFESGENHTQKIIIK